MIADTVSDLTDKYDHDYRRECVAEKRRPIEFWEGLADLEFVGITVPEEYGGEGPGMAGQAALVESVAGAGSRCLSSCCRRGWRRSRRCPCIQPPYGGTSAAHK
jgi:alkylation response protein AidB-like acyl-CoA dehydrogenase